MPLAGILLEDLGRGEEGLLVLLAAEGGVPVPPLDQAVQNKVEVSASWSSEPSCTWTARQRSAPRTSSSPQAPPPSLSWG